MENGKAQLRTDLVLFIFSYFHGWLTFLALPSSSWDLISFATAHVILCFLFFSVFFSFLLIMFLYVLTYILICIISLPRYVLTMLYLCFSLPWLCGWLSSTTLNLWNTRAFLFFFWLFPTVLHYKSILRFTRWNLEEGKYHPISILTLRVLVNERVVI